MQKMQHTYITGKELDLLEYFYRKRKGHVREIKKAVKLSEHTLLKYLSSLENRKMLHAQKEGNLKVYYANLDSALLKIFFSYFDIERLETLDYKRAKAVKMFVFLVKNIKIPYFVLLFGSTSKMNYTAESDIDIIVVFDGLNKHITNGIDEIRKKILAETGLRINSIVMNITDFLKEKQNAENYALMDAISTGYPVFGNQLYYEAIF